MAKRKKLPEEQVERELTRKEIRLRERERERHRVLYMGVGAALGLALLLIIAGVVYQFAYVPNSTVATVAGEPIIAKDFWRRMRLEHSQLQNQLVNMQLQSEQLSQQFGEQFVQQYLAPQMNQIQAQLQSPFALGVSVLDKLIDEHIVAREAVSRSITVSDDEVEEALREEIARNRNAITAPQATSTGEAATNATATATLWTPTPTPTIDANLVVTATATPVPTTPPLPTSAILSDTGYAEGKTALEEALSNLNSVDLAEYRQIIKNRLLADKLAKVIGEEKVSPTETQVHARHILIRVMTPTVAITDTGTITAPLAPATAVTGTSAVTTGAPVSPSVAVTNATPATTTATVTTTSAVTAAAPVTTTPVVTAATAVTAAAPVSATAGVTTAAPVTGTVAPTRTTGLTATTPVTPTTPPAQVERTDAAARALAEEIRQRILAGEDFAALARQYSDDTGSGAQGGDLGWFGRGQMVPPFEEAAFSLPISQTSELIKTQYGYHIIQVLEKDENRPKDPNKLEQERQQAYQTWLQEAKTATPIERPDDLTAILPRDLRQPVITQ